VNELPSAPPAADRSIPIEDYALSVLLHDIGKFWERCSDAPRPTPAELGLYCPHVGETGSYLHVHAALSARFIEEYVKKPGAARWGPKHHLPDDSSREEVCAGIADLLAGGETEPDESRDAPDAAVRALRSPLPPPAAEAEPRFLPFGRADGFPESVLPRPVVPVSREDYRFHWNHFVKALDTLGAASGDLESWLAVLEVFLGRIPAAATNRQLRAIPDIDLFTHSRVTAALAAALLLGPFGPKDLLVLREDLFRPAPEKLDRPLASIVAAEIIDGGLRSAAGGDSLRGRLLFLDLAVGGAARRFAARLGLPASSVLLTGGGRFAILAPPDPAWEAARDEIEDVLAADAGGELGIEAAAANLTLRDFRSGMERTWGSLDAALGAARKARIPRLARRSYDRLFGAGFEPAPAAAEAGSALPATFEALGARARDARSIARVRPDAAPAGFQAVLLELGGAIAAGTEEAIAALPGLAAVRWLGRLDVDAAVRVRGGRPAAIGFRAWPVETGRGAAAARGGAAGKPAPAAAEGSTDRVAEAVLVVALDGLRRLVGLRLPPGGASLARIVALLDRTRQFIEGWASAEVARGESGPLALLYASPEGLVAAGSLPAAVALARSFRKAFAAFAGTSTATVCAGLSAGSGAEPFEERVLAAREGLEAARTAGILGPPEEADRISILGAVLRFDELEAIEETVRAAAEIERSGPRRGLPGVLAAAELAGRRARAFAGKTGPLSVEEFREALSWKRRERSLAAALGEAGAGKDREAPPSPLGRLRDWALAAEAGGHDRLSLVVRWLDLLSKGEGR
jgi:hypothetical protein